MAASSVGAAVLEWDFSTSPTDWELQGATELFSWDQNAGKLRAKWDSSKTNSFYSVQLPTALTISDSFSCQFDLELSSIEIGTTPGKPYTFQVAVGFFNSAASLRPEFFAGTGTDSEHGPRNLVEFNYFPDSGFGATIAPIVVSRDNQIFYSHNFPLEMVPGNVYTIQMSFEPSTRTLQSTILENGEPYGVGGDGRLRSILLPARFTDFSLDRFGVSSYSDAGQTDQFAGSILAQGTLDNVKLVLADRPRPILTVTAAGTQLQISFPTSSGYSYQLEGSVDLKSWSKASEIISGTGNSLSFSLQNTQSKQFFRLKITRP